MGELNVSHKEMNLVSFGSKSVSLYTYIDSLFEAIPELQGYNYLISDLNINRGEDHLLYQSDPLIIGGKELLKIVSSENIQFIWAVISGFEGDVTVSEVLPYADGNPNLWIEYPQTQIEEASFEIICWDSSATLFIEFPDVWRSKLEELYPDIEELKEHIKQ